MLRLSGGGNSQIGLVAKIMRCQKAQLVQFEFLGLYGGERDGLDSRCVADVPGYEADHVQHGFRCL
jgi:hypothetical protein